MRKRLSFEEEQRIITNNILEQEKIDREKNGVFLLPEEINNKVEYVEEFKCEDINEEEINPEKIIKKKCRPKKENK